MWIVDSEPTDELVSQYGWKSELIARALLTLLRNARARASNKKIPFVLTYEYLEMLYLRQSGNCFYSGREMALETDSERKTKRTSLMVSLDKLEPSKGYVAGNVCLCCCDVNIAKADLSESEFKAMCEAVAGYLWHGNSPRA